jgi:hypothetical protein
MIMGNGVSLQSLGPCPFLTFELKNCSPCCILSVKFEEGQVVGGERTLVNFQ